MTESWFAGGRVLVLALEGWNDAGDAATGAVRTLREALELQVLADIDPEEYFDYQFNRPLRTAEPRDGSRIVWPGVTLLGPVEPTPLSELTGQRFDVGAEPVRIEDAGTVYLMLGSEPSRRWKLFCQEFLDLLEQHAISSIVTLGALLADVPHSRPISVMATSDDSETRRQLELERSSYEGPVGMPSVLADAAAQAGVPTVSIWASVPHYVHAGPSPKATLALLERLEEVLGLQVPRGELETDAAKWEAGIDSLTAEDEEMVSYIQHLERERDAVESPEASGDAIAQEFERYLRRRERPDDDPRMR